MHLVLLSPGLAWHTGSTHCIDWMWVLPDPVCPPRGTNIQALDVTDQSVLPFGSCCILLLLPCALWGAGDIDTRFADVETSRRCLVRLSTSTCCARVGTLSRPMLSPCALGRVCVLPDTVSSPRGTVQALACDCLGFGVSAFGLGAIQLAGKPHVTACAINSRHMQGARCGVRGQVCML